MAKKQLKPIDAFRVFLNQSGIFPTLVTQAHGTQNSFLVFSFTGFEQYEFKNGSASKLLEDKWENWTSATVDYLFSQSVFTFKSDTKTFELKVSQQGKDVAALIKANTNIHLEEIPRKWWNKILGFRSKTKWKMVVATISYLVVFGMVISAIGGENATAPTTKATSQPVKTAELSAQKKAEAAKITALDKELLKKSYSTFDAQQIKQFAEIKEKYKNLPNAEVADISADFVRISNEEAVEVKKQAEAKAIADAKEAYKKWVKDQFSAWDGSNRYLVDLVKEHLNDPKSFQHVETSYADKGDHLLIKMIYRAKNGFGGLVLQNVTGKSDYKTQTISIISQNN